MGEKRGLKDHERQEMNNNIRDALKPLIQHPSLRIKIYGAMKEYLKMKDLRIDKRNGVKKTKNTKN